MHIISFDFLYYILHIYTQKIMPREQNAHAIVNAGFLFNLNNNGTLLTKPNIIFGGINPHFVSEKFNRNR
jgi:hypothetical protein